MISITEQEFLRLTAYIKENFGLHLRNEKKTLLCGRLHHVLLQHGCHTFTEYCHRLMKDQTGALAAALIDRITTNHTYFLREADHFYYLSQTVLPFWFHAIKDHDLRIWCAGCATGEEAYTLAMFIDTYFSQTAADWDTKILATDISPKVLQVAKKGIYSRDKIDHLPAVWKHQYFRKHDPAHVVVAESLKKNVIYRNFNLVTPVFPFRRKFHAIFCRNVMIYFDTTTKQELVQKLYEQLEYGGYLFIGHSEALNRETTQFKYVMPAVYRKI